MPRSVASDLGLHCLPITLLLVSRLQWVKPVLVHILSPQKGTTALLESVKSRECPQKTFKVLCILHHWGVQLILAYSWARPAILVVGKGIGGMFLFLLFLHFLSCSSFFPVPLFHLLYSLSSISFLPFSGRRHKMTLKG